MKDANASHEWLACLTTQPWAHGEDTTHIVRGLPGRVGGVILFQATTSLLITFAQETCFNIDHVLSYSCPNKQSMKIFQNVAMLSVC